MADATTIPIRFTTGDRAAGLAATPQPAAGTSEVWLLGALPSGIRVKAGDRFVLAASQDRRVRTVITAIAAHGGGLTLTCSVAG